MDEISDGEIISDDDDVLSPDKEVQILSSSGTNAARNLPTLPTSVPDRPRNPLAMYQELNRLDEAGENEEFDKISSPSNSSSDQSDDDTNNFRDKQRRRSYEKHKPKLNLQRSLDERRLDGVGEERRPQRCGAKLWSNVLTDQTLETDIGSLLEVKEKSYKHSRGVESYDYTVPTLTGDGEDDKSGGGEERINLTVSRSKDTLVSYDDLLWDDVVEVENDGKFKTLEGGEKRVEEDEKKRVDRKRRFEGEMMEVCDEGGDENEMKNDCEGATQRKRMVKQRLGCKVTKMKKKSKGNVIACGVDDPPDKVSKYIIEILEEKKGFLIEAAVTQIGVEKSLSLLQETLDIEDNGGMLIVSGLRRRTAGGVFLYLLRIDPSIPDDVKQKLFSQSDTALQSERTKTWKEKKRKKRSIMRRKQRAPKTSNPLVLPSGKDACGGDEMDVAVIKPNITTSHVENHRANKPLSSSDSGSVVIEHEVERAPKTSTNEMGEESRGSSKNTNRNRNKKKKKKKKKRGRGLPPSHHPITTSSPTSSNYTSSNDEMSYEKLLESYKAKRVVEEATSTGNTPRPEHESCNNYDGSSEGTTTTLSVEKDFLEISVESSDNKTAATPGERQCISLFVDSDLDEDAIELDA